MDINVSGHNPFAPKLTRDWQCFIFAAHHYKQISHALLARAFNVNSQTVGKICRAEMTGRYSAVYNISRQLGVERMWDTYSTPELIKAVEDLAHREQTRMLIVQNHYVASGIGIYYLKDSKGHKIAVEIMPIEEINKEQSPSDQPGFYYKPNGAEFWCINEEFGRPFRSVEEVLRYLAAYPDALDQ